MKINSDVSSASGGLSGLVSGMDTESMVEKMLAGTKAKLDAQKAEKQRVTWRQEMYRDIVSKINTFYDKYFNNYSKVESTTNFLSPSFWNALSVKNTSSAIKVTASSYAATGRRKIEVNQLATKARVESAEQVCGSLEGKISEKSLSREVTLDVEGVDVTVDLDAITHEADGSAKLDAEGNPVVLTNENIAQAFKDAIKAKVDAGDLNEGDISVSVGSNGKLAFTGSKKMQVSPESGTLGLETLGFVPGARSGDDGAGVHALVGTVALNPGAMASVKVTLDGVSSTITLDKYYSDAKGRTGILGSLQAGLDKAFGTNTVKVLDGSGNAIDYTQPQDGKGFQLKVDGLGRQLYVDTPGSGLSSLSMANGASNMINTGLRLRDINFKNGLQGNEFDFTINGVKIHANADDTIADVVNRINQSGAGVICNYNSYEDRFFLEATQSGKGFGIEVSQEKGNLLGAMFGNIGGNLSTGNSITSDPLKTDSVQGSTGALIQGMDASDDSKTITTGTFAFIVGTEKYTFTFPDRTEKDADGNVTSTKPYTKEEIMGLINEQLEAKQGFTADGQRSVELVENSDGTFSMVSRNGLTVSFEASGANFTDEDGNYDPALTAEAAKTDLTLAFGFGVKGDAATGLTAAKQSNMSEETSLSDLGLGALSALTKADGTPAQTLADLGERYNAETGRLTLAKDDLNTIQAAIDAEADPATQADMQAAFDSAKGKLFGNVDVSLDEPMTSPAATVEAGQNAIITINGNQTERNTNKFTIDGLNLELEDVTNAIQYEMEADGVTPRRDADGNLIPIMNGGKYSTEHADGTGQVEIDVDQDTERIYEGVKEFVKDYNELIDGLNKLVDADDTYKEYDPLTAEQKKEMSEKEIELWEEKAKEGLLRKDSAITAFLSQMRSILFSKPEGAKYALYDMGIDTSEWRDKGKLIIEDETQLHNYISTDPQAISNLFIGPNGLAKQLQEAIKKTAYTSSGNPGELVQLAGVKGLATDGNNTLSKQLDKINDRIKDLTSKYETEKKRYWSQFNAMEQMIQNMNSQSSWLAMQFS